MRIDNPHDLAPEEPARDVVFSTTIALKYAYGIGDVGGVVFEASPAPPGQPPFRDVSVEATVQELAVCLGSTLYF